MFRTIAVASDDKLRLSCRNDVHTQGRLMLGTSFWRNPYFICNMGVKDRTRQTSYYDEIRNIYNPNEIVIILLSIYYSVVNIALSRLGRFCLPFLTQHGCHNKYDGTSSNAQTSSDTECLHLLPDFFLRRLCDIHQFEIKFQMTIGWDGPFEPFVTVGQMRWNAQGTLPANFHALKVKGAKK